MALAWWEQGRHAPCYGRWHLRGGEVSRWVGLPLPTCSSPCRGTLHTWNSIHQQAMYSLTANNNRILGLGFHVEAWKTVGKKPSPATMKEPETCGPSSFPLWCYPMSYLINFPYGGSNGKESLAMWRPRFNLWVTNVLEKCSRCSILTWENSTDRKDSHAPVHRDLHESGTNMAANTQDWKNSRLK